jgi:3-dehydroquinate synthase
MHKKTYTYSSGKVEVYFDAAFGQLNKVVDRKKAIIVTDEHVFKAHHAKFKNWNVITLKPGEAYKIQPTADAIVEQLIAFQADRSSILVGVGGGVITDLTGYVASIYMRGIQFGFVPTSLLAMVDASIGGKNGIDVGEYKNMVGVIRQPSFLFYDTNLLSTLPHQEWVNGCAEIIKHGAVLDAKLFKQLDKLGLQALKSDKKLLKAIVRKNVELKSTIVKRDEFEKGDRKLLNFGHTLGHALETQYELTHGQAVALGMVFAAWLSEQLLGFKHASLVEKVLVQYGLPTRAVFDVDRVFEILKMDKKRLSKQMRFVLLSKLGKGEIVEIPLTILKKYLVAFNTLNKKQK